MSRKNFVRFKPEQKYHYHRKRSESPGPNGMKFGSPKHCYSIGFTDGFFGINNSRAINGEFGAKSQKSYDSGHFRGRKAFREFFNRTGKQAHAVRDYK